jgi:hypothetical protein
MLGGSLSLKTMGSFEEKKKKLEDFFKTIVDVMLESRTSSILDKQ